METPTNVLAADDHRECKASEVHICARCTYNVWQEESHHAVQVAEREEHLGP